MIRIEEKVDLVQQENDPIVAKTLLLGEKFTSTLKYAKRGVVLNELCPVCGKIHKNSFAVEYDGTYAVKCPETGVYVYGVYA